MKNQVFRIRLALPGMSERWLEWQRLSPSQCREIELNAARLAGETGTLMTIRKLELQHGAAAMVVGLTEEPCVEVTAETRWLRPSSIELITPGPLHFDSLFTAKEAYYLEQLFRTEHEVTSGELQIMQGKAIAVATPG